MAWGLYIPNLVCGFGALGIMVPGIKKLRPGDGAFFLAYYGVAMGCTWLLSAPRYLAVCYPLALGLGALGPGKARLAAVEPAGLHVPAAGWVYLPIYPGLSRVLTRLDESPFPVIR